MSIKSLHSHVAAATAADTGDRWRDIMVLLSGPQLAAIPELVLEVHVRFMRE